MNFTKGGETLTWKFWHDFNQAEVKPEYAATDLFRNLDASQNRRLEPEHGLVAGTIRVRILLLLQVNIQRIQRPTSLDIQHSIFNVNQQSNRLELRELDSVSNHAASLCITDYRLPAC